MKDNTIALGSLCDLVSEQVQPEDSVGRPYLGLEHLTPGEWLPTAQGHAFEVQSSKFSFKAGDILYGKLRPYLDKAVLAQFAGICTTELLVLRAKTPADSRFLLAVVHSHAFREFAMAGVTGAHHPRTSWHHIKEFETNKLEPDDRVQIGDVLWDGQMRLAAAKNTGIALTQLKNATMRDVFTRGLQKEGQKDTEVGPMPESWRVVSLGDLGRVGNGSTPRKGHTAYWEGGHYPWLTSAKVYEREIIAADQYVTDAALDECHLPRVGSGSVVMAITGQGKTLGHCAVLRIEATVNQHIAFIAIEDQEAVSPSFLRGYLETKYDYLRQIASGGGSTKGALTCSFLRSMKIPMPADDQRGRAEQLEIVEVLDAVDTKIAIQEKKRALLQALFDALLHNLMTGEIRVSDLDLSALLNQSAEAVL